MVDVESRRIIDMIPSRDCDDVKTWLTDYPSIAIVSRDGSNAYRNAISEALPDAVQVSDRFHLLKNLIDYSKEYLKKEIGKNVKIISGDIEKQGATQPLPRANENRKLTNQEKRERLWVLVNQGYGKAAICKELSMDSRTYDKYYAQSSAGNLKVAKPKKVCKHEESVTRKWALINDTRELKRQGFSNMEISRRVAVDRKTVARYLDPGFNPVSATYGTKHSGGALASFVNGIDGMLSQGLKGTEIESWLRENGYSGSSSNIRHYISGWKNNRKHDYDKSRAEAAGLKVVARKTLFKLLYHQLSQVKEITEPQFCAIMAQMPVFAKIHDLVWGFRGILAAKDAGNLAVWLEKAADLDIAEINSFVAGIKKDIDAVTNAIALPYSNGLAEGSINKMKVIKRIMYGRCGFSLLRQKILHLESGKYNN
jgi:DNA-binding NarL/FixJ family response regulator